MEIPIILSLCTCVRKFIDTFMKIRERKEIKSELGKQHIYRNINILVIYQLSLTYQVFFREGLK